MKALVPTGQNRALVALADTGVPEPQPGEALVKVEAFSVNRGNVGIFTVRDGKIAAVREYTDTQHAAHVLFGQP